jgi:tyrosine-protein kinase Etk/Wzc
MDTRENQEGVKVTIKDFILRYIRYLPLFIISAGLFLISAYFYLKYATKYYNARATILIKSDNGPRAGKSDQEFESLLFYKGGNNVDNEIEILKSLNLSKRVAKELDLQHKCYAIGNIKTSLIYPELPFRIDILKLNDSIHGIGLTINLLNGQSFTIGEDKKVYYFDQPFNYNQNSIRITKDSLYGQLQYKQYVCSWEPLESAAFDVLGSIKVGAIKDRSDVLLLSCETIQPKLGEDVLNQLMLEYKQSSIEDKNQIAQRTISFINERLKLLTEELGGVEKNLQQFKQNNGIINIQSQSSLYLGDQSELTKQLTEKELMLSNIHYLQDYIKDRRNEFATVATTFGVNEPTLVQLAKEYNELQLQRERELKTTPSGNSVIKSMEGQLEKLRANLLEALKNIEGASRLAVNEIQRQSSGFKTNINAIPLKEKELLEITRQQGIKQSLYLYLLQKREETSISLASTISNSQVVDAATSSSIPVRPNPLNIKILALFLGVLLPLIFIYIKELLNDKVSSKTDITKFTAAPVFGEIAHSEEHKALVVEKTSRSIISEQFRMIRSNLQYLVGDIEKPVMLVTSSFSGEGKSFVSINMGAVLALTGKRTLILEFDIRKPKILQGLEMERSQGITNFLVGNKSLAELVLPVPGIDNLFVLPCGAIPPNPSEILLHEKLQEIFAFARNRFDAVIMDTAPVGLVSDAYTLSKFADCTLYLARLGHTLKKQVHFIEEIYRNNKLPKMALLVNDIKASSHYYSYGNYSGYGYGYGYGYYTEAESLSKNPFIRFFQKVRMKLRRIF